MNPHLRLHLSERLGDLNDSEITRQARPLFRVSIALAIKWVIAIWMNFNSVGLIR